MPVLRSGLILIIVSSYLISFSIPAFCEYNLATEKEETLFISSEKETAMGESISKQVEKKIKLDKNYTNQEKVRTIGQKIAEVSDRKDIIYRFKVLDDDTDNAFAVPGGYIYIFKGLLERLNDDEIAAILAHEVGHICARHSVKRLQNSLGYEILRVLVMRGAQDSYTRRKANEAVGQLMMAHSREDEMEADRLAIKYLGKAGYKPEAMVTVIDKLLEAQMEGPIRSKRYWYTHPYLGARKAAANQEITGQLDFDDYLNVATEEDYIIRR